MIHTIDIPFDEHSSFKRGSALAPAKIREAFHSDSSNYFTESGVDLKDHPEVKYTGAVKFIPGASVPGAIEYAIRQLVRKEDDKVFTLGGDHSITYPIIKALAQQYPNLSIVHIDAHPDLYDHFDGNKLSHASPFARIMEEGLAIQLIQVGIRTMNKHQSEQAEKFDVEVIEMKDWHPGKRFEIAGPLYISLDMDALDPAFAPGVSHQEPGGFSTRQVISILQNISVRVIGADLVEFNPACDPTGMTAMVAAKLYKEMLDLLLRSEE
jgi:agmatinase